MFGVSQEMGWYFLFAINVIVTPEYLCITEPWQLQYIVLQMLLTHLLFYGNFVGFWRVSTQKRNKLRI